MVLRFAAVFLELFLTGAPFVFSAGNVSIPRQPKIRSAAALVKDQRTGELLITKQADVAMPIASITKLMTAMVVLDAHLDMDELITIEEADKDTLRNSHSHLFVGTQLTRGQALLLALMASENRAARALGRTYPGGIDALVTAMNEKARALDLPETKFEDPAGLSDGNVSSAKDLSRLVEAASRYPRICADTTQAETTIQLGRRRLHFVNTNSLVRDHRWQISLSKTGYLEDAGRCLVMQTELGQRPVLIVLLNSIGKYTRFADANRIKQWIEGPPKSRKAKRSTVRSRNRRVNRI